MSRLPILLLVEDDGPTVRGLRVALRAEFEVHTLTSRHATREWIEEHTPSVAIIDLTLDDGNGSDLIPLIRSRFSDCGIVVMTGDAGRFEGDPEILDDPNLRVFEKPFYWMDLYAFLAKQKGEGGRIDAASSG